MLSASPALLLSHLGGQRRHQLIFQRLGNRLRLTPLVDLQGLLGGVQNHPTVWTLLDMLVELFLGRRIETRV